jgi:hypothetical protein
MLGRGKRVRLQTGVVIEQVARAAALLYAKQQLLTQVTAINNTVAQHGLAVITPAVQQRYAQLVMRLGAANAALPAALAPLIEAKGALAPPPPPPTSAAAARTQAQSLVAMLAPGGGLMDAPDAETRKLCVRKEGEREE